MFLLWILFTFAAIISFYIPGYVLLNLLNAKLKKFELTISSWIIGVCLFLLTTYLLAWVNATEYSLIVISIFFFVYLYKIRFIFSKTQPGIWKNVAQWLIKYQKNLDYLSIIIVILGSISFLTITMLSGLETRNGIKFYGLNSVDGIEHLARIKNLAQFFPPTHPGLAGVRLNGYHYFYDFLVSRFVLLFHFKAEDLYFRLFPFLIYLFYGGAFYLIASYITKQKIEKAMVIFFVYFVYAFPLSSIPVLAQTADLT